jgi:two-component system, cell cycle sensor histidine kinase and response regulator CckA
MVDLAARFAAAVSRPRRELLDRVRQQEAVARLGQLALADASRQELLEQAVATVAAGLRADCCAVLEILPDGCGGVVRSAVGWDDATTSTVVPLGSGSHAGFTLENGRAVVATDYTTESRFAVSPQVLAQGLRSGLAVPIDSNGSRFGVIGAHTYARRDFSAHDVNFVQSVANVLSSAFRRSAAEDEAERSRALLAAVIEGTPDHIFVADTDGRYIKVNAACADAFGSSPDELVGKSVFDVFPHATAEQLWASHRFVLEGGPTRTLEETVVFGGREHVVLTTKGPYRAADGTLLGLFGIAHDITERKAQETALARSEARLRLAQEATRMGTWELDVRTGEPAWSDELCAVLGVDPAGDHTTELAVALAHPDDRERVVAAVRDAHAAGVDLELEYRVIRPDGEVRSLLTRSTVPVTHNGDGPRRLGVAIDITERKRAEHDLEALETRLRQTEKLEAIGKLAGGIAHDFNNLLVALRGYGEFALARLERGDDGAEEDVREMLAAADRAAALTSQLLAFGRRQVLQPEVLDLQDVVVDMSSLLRRVLGEDVELVTVLPGSPVRVEADRGRLEQVVTNLAVNARDAMPHGGTLTIELGVDGPYALLAVADTGTGIAPDVEPHIFEPFFTTKGNAGNGFGLATAHGIVLQSGGTIAVETAPGCGTTFRISLPLSSAAPSLPPPAPAGCPVNGSETILVVEDDDTVRTVVSAMLASHGYRVVAVDDGVKALERFDTYEEPISLVVSDLVMRGLDGRETTERIRAVAPDIRVLYMSGYTDDAVVQSGAAFDPGTGFIQKPFSGFELAEQVRLLLDA